MVGELRGEGAQEVKIRVMTNKHILVAMLSTAPQGVTRLLDWLLAEGYPIAETVIIHTVGKVIQPAIERLDAEFADGIYPTMRYQRVQIVSEGASVEDILSEEDAWALLRTVYRVLREAKRKGQTIHLSITSGRKTMAVYGMVAAQLLFGEHDCVWHLVSTEQWAGGVSKMMHAQAGEKTHVVPVPVVRWANAATAMALLEVDDPWLALQRQQTLTQRDMARRRKAFLEHYLSRKEREVLKLLAQEGLDNAGLARRLGKRQQTVANQLSSIYRKFDEWRGFPSEGAAACRAALIAEFAPYLSGD